MKFYDHPGKELWEEIACRPSFQNSHVFDEVRPILERVQKEGDKAIKEYTLQYDRIDLENFQVTEEEFAEAERILPVELKDSIGLASRNIWVFHNQQLIKEAMVDTMPGIVCWRKMVGIEKVGIYIPGGTAPLFSTVLMLGVPASIAGCKEIVMCTPPQENGSVHPAMLYAASMAGIKKVYKVGGAQAIAGMAFGTATIPAVYKIFGPGNQFVTAAKMLIQQQGIAIDMPAGPSEVMVVADATAVPEFVAADLLSQAEHGVDSQVMLIAKPEFDYAGFEQALEKQLNNLGRKGLASKALENSRVIIFDEDAEIMQFADLYAPEHLVLCTRNAAALADRVTNAGSVFVGNYSPESAGDYASGTNHTLPTNGFARMYSGVNVESFSKIITFQSLTKEGLQAIAQSVITMANAEELDAHAEAIKIRLNNGRESNS